MTMDQVSGPLLGFKICHPGEYIVQMNPGEIFKQFMALLANLKRANKEIFWISQPPN